MERVISKDGTPIAFDRRGSGPTVILVGGGLDDGSENVPLAAELPTHFTSINYARRGRADSGDSPPYAVEREIEDIAALIGAAGGSAHLVGISSGGMFALEAVAAGLSIDRIAVYDVPYDTSADAPERYDAYRQELATVLAEGRRGDAVELFMRLAGSSDEDIAGAKGSPFWPGLEVLAHTLVYDAALYGQPPTARLATIQQPVLVASGGGSGGFFEPAADAVAAALPNAERLFLEGQGHVVDPKAFVRVLQRFFGRLNNGW